MFNNKCSHIPSCRDVMIGWEEEQIFTGIFISASYIETLVPYTGKQLSLILWVSYQSRIFIVDHSRNVNALVI